MAGPRSVVKDRVSIAALQQMKRDGRKIVAVVVYDFQMAQIVDRGDVDLVSVGDSVGVTMWAHRDETEVTLEQMLLACTAVRRGVRRALVSCDFPWTAAQEGVERAVAAARRLMAEGGADLIKLDAAPDHLDMVRAMTGAGVPVWAQFGITPHTAARYGADARRGAELAADHAAQFVADARQLEAAGAAMLDFTHSGPVAGPQVVQAVAIPVLGGLGGGPWLDGRIRALGNAIGYLASALDDTADRYANVARVAHDAVVAYAGDVRAGRQIRGR